MCKILTFYVIVDTLRDFCESESCSESECESCSGEIKVLLPVSDVDQNELGLYAFCTHAKKGNLANNVWFNQILAICVCVGNIWFGFKACFLLMIWRFHLRSKSRRKSSLNMRKMESPGVGVPLREQSYLVQFTAE